MNSQPEKAEISEGRLRQLNNHCVALPSDVEMTMLVSAYRENRKLRELCSCMYQVAGEVNLPVKFLDALNSAANGETFSTDSLLPWTRGDSDGKGCCPIRNHEVKS